MVLKYGMAGNVDKSVCSQTVYQKDFENIHNYLFMSDGNDQESTDPDEFLTALNSKFEKYKQSLSHLPPKISGFISSIVGDKPSPIGIDESESRESFAKSRQGKAVSLLIKLIIRVVKIKTISLDKRKELIKLAKDLRLMNLDTSLTKSFGILNVVARELSIAELSALLYDIRSAYTSTSLADSYFWRWVEQSFSFFIMLSKTFGQYPVIVV